MTDLVVENIHKKLGTLQILKGASFTAHKCQIVALLGASGSGKTTLLRCLAGLEMPEQGRIVIAGADVLDSAKNLALPPEKRNIGLVFQSYALWPHRTVIENVAFGLKLRGVSAAEITARVKVMLDKMGLGALGDRYPYQLSGGQQQRVAICRALVYEPKVLLLDEPLSNLDAKLREEARYWIRKLILDLKICAIMVTHDQSEALAMADEVLLLKDGVIVQKGSPIDIYSRPNSFYAAEFLGTNNVVKGRVTSATDSGVTIEGPGWSLQGTAQGSDRLKAADEIAAVIRVESLRIASEAGPDRLEMDVEASMYLGDRWEHRLRRGDLHARAHGPLPLQQKSVWCEFPQQSVWVFPAA